jgi:azurin
MKHFIGIMVIALMMVGCGPSFDQTIEIETLGNQMSYNTPVIKAKAGSIIKIVFKNNATMSVMKHNIVVLKSADDIDSVGKAAITATNYVPETAQIIAASDLIGPGESTDLVVNIPTAPGEYPFICTFPGHYQVMQGKIVVN